MPGYRLQLSHKPQLNPAAPPCPVLSFFHSLNIPWLSTKQQFVGINKGFKVTEKCVCVCVCVCVWDVCVCVIACVCVSEGLCILCVCVSVSVCDCLWVCLCLCESVCESMNVNMA